MNKIKIITFQNLKNIHISPKDYVDWIKQSFINKEQAILPKKISLSDREQVFYNFMPSIVPNIQTVGIKNVFRIPQRKPALQAHIMLYDQNTGNLKAIMDGTYITAIRTGAVAALSILTLARSNFYEIGIIGLGNCSRSTIDCLLSIIHDHQVKIKLYRYKNYADEFINRFSAYKNVEFTVVDSYEKIVENSDVILSAITYTEKNLCENNALYKPGCLVVPIHTRGFMNCDQFFDKFIVDDIGHVKHFKYFQQYPYVAELHKVLLNVKAGRENNHERIMAYNIGLSIHDMYFAHQFYNLIEDKHIKSEFIYLDVPKTKFWV